MRLDRVDSVTVGANRSRPIPTRNCLSVNALREGICYCRMALAAGRWNIEFIDWRTGVAGGKYLVRAMAIGANRSLRRSVFGGVPMDAFLVRDEGLNANSVRLHQKLLPVAPAAGNGNVGVIDRRLGVISGQNLVRASMAILAVGCRSLAGLGRLGMQAAQVSLLSIRVALGAGDLLRRALMDQALDILVAINAGQDIAVDRMLQLAWVHIQANLFSIYFRCQSGVGVAGEAILVAELMLGASCTGAEEQR